MSNFSNLSPEDEEYLVHLPYHLAMAGMSDDLYDLLTEFEFIDTKVSALKSQSLIEDYDLALQSDLLTSGGLKSNADSLRLIQGALQLSSHILDQNKTQLAGQLLGRLLSFAIPEIQALLEQAKQWKTAPWLRPLTPTLTPPNEQLLRTLTGHTHLVTSVAVTSDGKRVISGSLDKTLKVWNLETGEKLFTLRGHTLPITSVAVTPDGKLAISGSWGKTLKVWDLEARKELFPLIGHTCMVTAIAVTPDGKRVISASLDKTLKVWDLEARKEVSTLTLTVPNRMGLLKLVCTLLKIPFLGKVVLVILTFLRLAWVNALVVTSDGKQAILALNTNLMILNLETGETFFTTKGDNDRVTTLTAIPTINWIIYGLWDGTINVKDLETGEEFYPLKLELYSTWISAVAVTPDGKRLVSGSLDKTLKIWKLNKETEKDILKRSGHAAGVNTVAVIPNGNRVISSSGDNTLKVWNWQTGEKIITINLECFPTRITALAVTITGQQVISEPGIGKLERRFLR